MNELDKIEKQNYQNIIDKYGRKAAEAIKEKRVYVGMTSEMTIASWGEPLKINRTVNQYGTREQWIYGDGDYIYFENGKLTSIQTSE